MGYKQRARATRCRQTFLIATDCFWPISAGQGAPIARVRSDANDWASRMQMAGQVECNSSVKVGIKVRTHLDYWNSISFENTVEPKRYTV